MTRITSAASEQLVLQRATVTEKKTSSVVEFGSQEKTPGGLAAAILEMAEALHRNGIMNDAAYEWIMVRHLGAREAARRLAALKRPCP